MKGNCIIPVRNENLDMLFGEDFMIDTKGLSCRIKVSGGSVGVSLKEGAFARFPVLDGEDFDFCGKLYCHITSGTPTVHCMYYTTL